MSSIRTLTCLFTLHCVLLQIQKKRLDLRLIVASATLDAKVTASLRWTDMLDWWKERKQRQTKGKVDVGGVRSQCTDICDTLMKDAIRPWMCSALVSWNAVSDIYCTFLFKRAFIYTCKLFRYGSSTLCPFFMLRKLPFEMTHWCSLTNRKIKFIWRNSMTSSTWTNPGTPTRTRVEFWQWRDAPFLWTSSTLSGSRRTWSSLSKRCTSCMYVLNSGVSFCLFSVQSQTTWRPQWRRCWRSTRQRMTVMSWLFLPGRSVTMSLILLNLYLIFPICITML